ncbi:hypothetical protein FisN_16Hh301 [Fistulifera solaris]|uniref:Major facilitator superfamily (MFS) profile domain-containing protein n=1 Tax=Fistulifera solaris TaxID=1519565 RepID=A0A1Z5KSK3_FISSO|nr:hypothetical protein FisN_16Hh301 [Fistulifera solaris]|eukprot:GAX29269.1 hypothetical protein FisN_16Hh301 [Fistulifera solaris]
MMEDDIDSGGFRALLEKVHRVEENVDWSIHSVDYEQFKNRLKFFAERRVKVWSIVRDSPDGRIAEDEWSAIAGWKLPMPPSRRGNNDAVELSAFQRATDRYVSMEDIPFQEDSKESDESVSSHGSLSKTRRRTKRHFMRRLSNTERNELTLFLAWEMDKAMMFYLTQWQKLSRRIEDKDRDRFVESTPTFDLDIANELLELFAFCLINIIVAQQILIRYDAFARAFEGTPMRNYYLKQVKKEQTAYRKILCHEELKAIADSFVEIQQPSNQLSHFCSQRMMFESILTSLESESVHDTVIRLENVATSARSLWKWFMVGLREGRLGLEPAYLAGSEKSLTDQIQQLVEWRTKKQEIQQPPKQERKLSDMQKYHLTLSLMSGFFYCMNYYIVEPSSTLYCNRLGAQDTMSGLLIGMTPLAAFISSIPYSMWTNHSFRQPFILSCVMLMFGNMLYSIADIFRNFPMAMMGRFICGMGAPKCIIRRYMADTTPMSLRTGVNAGFGMVVAAGSAMGPAMAVVLSKYEQAIAVPHVGYVTLNGLTLPGYFMAAIWFMFALLVVATFDEPQREGLLEQKQLEESERISDPITPEVPPPSYLEVSDSQMSEQDIELRMIFSGESHDYAGLKEMQEKRPASHHYLQALRNFAGLITFPVRVCLGLLFAKVFTIETLVSSTSSLTKNRYRWVVTQVGVLGFTNGLLVIPFSIFIGRLSLSFEDRILMRWLVMAGCFGFFLLIDLSDLVEAPTGDYNKGHILAVTPQRYIAGYFIAYLSVQAFEGVIGSALSKLIPTALASGTLNSGLLATLVDTFGRACGDIFISAVGCIELRQLLNLLFIPAFVIMLTCLVVIEKFHDVLSV